jgi:hypothetical protein
MKSVSKIIFFAAVVSLAFAACTKIDKADSLLFHESGSAVVLTASTNTIAPDRADSNNTVVIFNWTDPNYATDSAHIKYLLQVDTANGNFERPATREIIGNLTTSILAKQLNGVLIGFGLKAGKAYTIKFRLVSSYVNNNDQKISNTVTIQATPYLVPPKVVPPATRTLVLVGSATGSGWDNPVASQAQSFTMIDSVTYEGTFFLNGGGEYLLLPLNGNWDHKYNVSDKTLLGLKNGGVFNLDLSDNIPGPDATGMYKILVDFQNGKFTVTKVSEFGLLYMPGDYQGWTPATAQTLGSPANDGNFDGYVNIPAGGSNEFKFTSTPDWSNAYGDGGAGLLEPGGPSNLNVPAAGYYHITANTVANTWSKELITTWGLIGSFSPSNWNNSVPMTQDGDKWVGTITTIAGDQFKFRANNDWALNYGDNNGKGVLSAGGQNIGDASKNFAVPPGTHKITLYLGSPGYYTYTIE